MAVTVDSVIVSLEAKVDKYNRDVNSASANFDKKMGLIGASAGKMEKTTSRAFSGLKVAAAGFLASIGIDVITRAISAGLDYASSLGEVAQQLGVTTHALQFYRYVGTQVGLSNEEIDASLQKLTRSLGEAAQGSKAPKDALLGLGFSLAEVESGVLKAEDAIPRIADALAKIESPAKRAAIEVDLFGRAGQKLDTLLAGGSKQINALADAYKRLGIELTPEQIKNADAAADKLADVKKVLEARLAGVVADNADDIVDLANALGSLAEKAIKAAKAMKDFFGSQRGQTVKNLVTSFSPANGGLVGSAIRGDGIFTPGPTPAGFRGSAPGKLRGNSPGRLRGTAPAGSFAAGGLASLSGLDMGVIIDQLARAPAIVDQIAAATGRSAAAQGKLNGEADAFIESLVQGNRLALLRAEGRNQEADDIEAIARATEDVNSIEGLTAKQREQLLATARALTIEGLRQVETAARQLELETKYQQELADRVGSYSEDVVNSITKSINDELDAYTSRGEDTQRYLADAFEDLFTNGVGSVWQHFKREGLRAVAEVLAQIVFPSGSGGGGLLKGLVGAVTSIFGGGGPKFDFAAANATVAAIGRASGGMVSAGQLYRVNENGTEGFRPAQSGSIVPLGQMPNAMPAGAGARQPVIVQLAVHEGALFEPRVQQISGDVSVRIVQASAPSLIDASVSETFRRGGRPKL